MAESEKCSRNWFRVKTVLPCGNHFYTFIRLLSEALCCRVICTSVRLSVRITFFSNGRVRQEGEWSRPIKKNQIGWTHGGGGDASKYFFKFFLYTAIASLDYISLQAGRVRPGVGQGGSRQIIIVSFRMGGYVRKGNDQGLLKKSDRVGTWEWGEVNKYFLMFFFIWQQIWTE